MSKANKTAKLEYAERLKAYRKEAAVSQENLAKAIGVHQPYIADIESGTISIGIDKQEQIAAYFGVRYYEFADPNYPIPDKTELREHIEEYVKSTNTEPGYLKDESNRYSRYLDELLGTAFLQEAKTAKEISDEIATRFNVSIQPTRVSDILSRAPRKHLLVIIRPVAGRGNQYQLKK